MTVTIAAAVVDVAAGVAVVADLSNAASDLITNILAAASSALNRNEKLKKKLKKKIKQLQNLNKKRLKPASRGE